MRKSGVFKWLAIVITISLMVAAFAGCGSASKSADESGQKAATENADAKGEQKAANDSKKTEGFKIAFSNSYVGNSWRSESVKIFDSYAEQLKQAGEVSEYYSSSSGNDPQAQINEIRNLMSKGYDAILVNAASPTALAPVLEEAVDRGIVIVAFDNTVDSDKIYNVNTDQVEFGRIAAKWLMDQIGGEGNILMISGIEGTTVSRDRVQGYNEVLDEHPNVKVLQMGYGKWDDAATSVVINNMLAAHKSKGIVGILTEGGGENAIFEALKQHNIDPSTVPMTGEMTNGFFRHMKEDGVKGIAVGQPPYLSAASIDVALKALKGEQVDKLTLIPIPNATYEEVEKYYAPGQPDNFFVDWTDKDNKYNLKLEQILPNK
ncbi:substrate-binding domain-containing protein [Petroclostridium sp. X23]|uniref:substrate-binding domain-containing protein n=1 Tax=Petroclostridium sp. X23 TaxID=3045146 RepID=UPI0024AD4B30|nr:substrate-binding domain-containing protein [Petroclostridium sp. X23]WHH60372.1 substrate-binding domain-containing protein [Petroclostridium sp. X23]